MQFVEEHARLSREPLVNAMSVDVEDYFHVSAFDGLFPRAGWDRLDCRIPRNVDAILQMFADAGVKATFFTLGWVAERHPEVVRRIAQEGHEIASHGYEHVRATQQTPEAFRDDCGRTKKILEEVSGQRVTGYRAASFSVDRRNLWAFDVLREVGYVYSSSVNPIAHDLYGMPDAPRFAFRPGGDGILEIPITTVRVAGRRMPCGGGGFFRLFPYAAYRWGIARVNRQDRQPAVFYFHPWEVDPEQPRVAAKALSRFRHYLNLARMAPRLRQLLHDFRWARMDHVFLPR